MWRYVQSRVEEYSKELWKGDSKLHRSERTPNKKGSCEIPRYRVRAIHSRHQEEEEDI